MRLLANENVPALLIERLLSAGHDVVPSRRLQSGAPDAAVLALARAEQRIVLTFDKDFGELSASAGHGSKQPVILLKLRGQRPERIVQIVVDALTADIDWRSSFVVIEPTRIRSRPLP